MVQQSTILSKQAQYRITTKKVENYILGISSQVGLVVVHVQKVQGKL
jgi:hypothetical protein